MQTATSFILPNNNNDNDDNSSSSSNDNNHNIPYVELFYSIHRLAQSLLLCKQQQQENEGEIIEDDKNSNNKNNKKEPHIIQIVFFSSLSKLIVQYRQNNIIPNLIRSFQCMNTNTASAATTPTTTSTSCSDNNAVSSTLSTSSSSFVLDKRTQKNIISCHTSLIALICTHLSHLLSVYLPEEEDNNNNNETYSYSSFISAILTRTSTTTTTTTTPSTSNETKSVIDIAPFTQLIDSLIWFHKYSNTSYPQISQKIINPITSILISIIGSVFRDKQLSCYNDCYSLVISNIHNSDDNDDDDNNKLSTSENDHFLMEDFMYESDDSAMHYAFHDHDDDDDSDDDHDHEESSQRNYKDNNSNDEWKWLICRFRLTIHCISLLFSGTHDDKYCTYSDTNGPLLPLIVARILTYMSDIVLKNHYKLFIIPTLTTIADTTAQQQNQQHRYASNQYITRQGIWSESYPIGMAKTGEQCDNLLHKAYRSLHGFTLARANKETETSLHHNSNDTEAYYPESIIAATRLYRCMKRAYTTSTGRSSRSVKRIPPKAALEYVASALPKPVPTKHSRAMLEFLFCNPNRNKSIDPNNNKDNNTSIPSSFSSKDKLLKHLMINNSDTLFNNDHLLRTHKRGSDNIPLLVLLEQGDLTEEFPKWTLGENIDILQDIDTNTSNPLDIETYFVRKSLTHDLAQGPLPELPSSSSSVMKKRGVSSPPILPQGKSTTTVNATTATTTAMSDITTENMDNEIDNSATAISCSNNTEQREVLARHDKNLYKKFVLILEDLCHSPTNWDGWFQAAECLSMKAELICDRLMSCHCSYVSLMLKSYLCFSIFSPIFG